MAPTDYLSGNLTPKVDDFPLKSKKLTFAIAPRLILGGSGNSQGLRGGYGPFLTINPQKPNHRKSSLVHLQIF